MKKIYRFRSGLGLPAESAQAAGEEYERLKGFETRRQLRQIKHRPGSTLYKLVFTKGQVAAAEEFYLYRLREVVASLIEIEVEQRPGKKGRTQDADVQIGAGPRAFISIAKTNERSKIASVRYVGREEVRDDPFMRAQHVEQIIRDLRIWIAAAEPYKYKELIPLINSVKRALTKHGG